MELSFISQRLSGLNNYLNQLDKKIQNPANNIKNQYIVDTEKKAFSSVLNDFLNPTKTNNSSSETKSEDMQTSDLLFYEMKQLPDNFDDYIHQISKEVSVQYGVDISPNLVKSVIKQESNFNPDARSHAGAEGLMQLMPGTARDMGVFNSNNPYQNVKGGTKYLGILMNQFDGDLQKTLAAYNAGAENVKRYDGIPPFTETKNYVNDILNMYLRVEHSYEGADVIG